MPPSGDDMTDAELDALIAEQSKPENLPSWWWAHVELQRRWDAEAGRVVAESWEWSACAVRGRGLSKFAGEAGK
jgi:hypothetical protein